MDPAPRATVSIERLSSAATRPLPQRDAHTPEPAPPRDELEEAPRRIGRFYVLRELGRGGMGVVYLAYDDELDRQLAIKLLRRGDGGTEGATRMHREAQAMARISHPNVVQVYDVGRHEGAVYVAMEYVHGETLREWMRRGGHPWRAVVDVLVKAGRGLAAAHDAGLVHRDFKPSNVLLGEDGRVRVLDFGLAREDGPMRVAKLPRSLAPGERITGSHSSLLHAELTQAGSVIGTPAYMPPEQIDDDALSPRSDIFSFCVTLHEALYGRRPFQAKTLPGLFDRIKRGARTKPDTLGSAPARLYRVIERGLAVAPAERWGSMHELIAALERDPARDLRRALVFVTVAAALVLLTAFVLQRPRGPAICHDVSGALRGVWDSTRRGELRAAITATGASFAATAAARAESELDAHAARFEQALGDSCATVTAGDERSTSLVPLQCLELRREELRALVDVLAAADDAIVEHTVELVDGLADPQRCRDPRRLRARAPYPEDPARSAAVVRARVELEGARAELRAGRFVEAATRVEGLAERFAALEYPPIEAERLLLLADTHQANAAFEPAGDHAERAYHTALRSGHDVVATEALISAAIAHARALSHDVSLQRALDAGALLERLGFADGEPNELLARQIGALGYVYLRTPNHGEQAREHLRRALALHERVHPPDSPKLVAPLSQLAHVELALGEREAALEHAERALALNLAAYGDDHPRVAGSHNDVGLILKNLARRDEAERHLLRSLELTTRYRGEHHPSATINHRNLARLYSHMGRLEDAARHHRAVVESAVLNGDDGGGGAAIARYELASVMLGQGRRDDARRLLEDARERLTDTHPETRMTAARIEETLGTLALERGDASAARSYYESAVRRWQTTPRPNPGPTAVARLGLARALWRERERERALEEARRARAELRALDDVGSREQLALVDEWLRARER